MQIYVLRYEDSDQCCISTYVLSVIKGWGVDRRNAHIYICPVGIVALSECSVLLRPTLQRLDLNQ
jgi:hypothetical protein